jgi:ketosteroid isomerase-like protein
MAQLPHCQVAHLVELTGRFNGLAPSLSPSAYAWSSTQRGRDAAPSFRRRWSREENMIGAILARKAVADAFGALGRHDLPTFMNAWRDDGVFIYPGAIAASGTFKGKPAVESWFRGFMEQFPTIDFQLRGVCLASSLDLVGNNRAAVEWHVELVNREGRKGRNDGVTVIDIHRGRVLRARDYIFDLGEEFRRNWGIDPASVEAGPH